MTTPMTKSNTSSSGSEYEFPTSSELVADSYNQNVDETSIYFCALNSDEVDFNSDIKALWEAFKHCGYNNIERKDLKTKADLEEFKNKLQTEAFSSEAVLTFWFGEASTAPDKSVADSSQSPELKLTTGNQNIKVSIRELWEPIVGNKSLHEKPKIVMFFSRFPKTKSNRMETDVNTFTYKMYEAPLEADVFILIQSTVENRFSGKGKQGEEAKKTYVQELSSKIKEYGGMHDLVNIVSIPENYNPISISTLTRKFYLTSGTRVHHRGIQFRLDAALTQLEQILQ